MAKEGRTQPHSPGVGASFDVLTQVDNSLERRIDSLEAGARTNKRRALTIITPGSPFIIGQKVVKKGIEVTCQIELPPASSIQFITAIYRAADETTEREQTWEDIKQSDVDNAHFEGTFDKALEPSTNFVLVALIAKGDFPTSRKTRNPDPPDPASSLATWTTIGFFPNDPSKPDIGLIVENKFDDVTKAFDAFIVERVYAPINGIYTAYTGTVTINGTTTVTGTVTFVGQVAVGMLISVNSQSREVLNVSGSTITVDLPFIGSGSGLELLWGNPHTWQSALVNAVVSRFRLSDDGNAIPIDQRHDITDDEQTQTHIDFRVSGFVAARKYDWVRNVLIGESGRKHVLAASTQTFIAGGFKADTAGIPELTSPQWKYGLIDPNNDGLRTTQFFVTQPNPPVALDNVEIQRRVTLSGTIAYTSGVAGIVGTGTSFTTELNVADVIVVGVYLAAGYQRMAVTSITDDTHLAVESTSLPTATASGQAYKAGRILSDRGIRRAKFHPATGGVIKFNLGDLKTKKLAAQDFVVILTSQKGNQREDVDNFTTGSSSDTATPGALAFPSAPSGANNSVDGDPEKAQARIVFALATANGLGLDVNNITAAGLSLIERNADNTANVGATIGFQSALGVSGASTFSREIYLPIGRHYRLLTVFSINGDKRTITGPVSPTDGDFVSGGVLTVDPSDAKVVPAPGLGTITRLDGGNKIDLVPVYIIQDGASSDPPVLLKHLYREVAVNGGSFEREPKIGLKGVDQLYVSDQLNGAIDASVTTITVDSTGPFKTPSTAEPILYFSIGTELISYTGLTSTTFTGCVRGVDGTTAAAHADNAKVSGAYREQLRIKRKAGVSAQYRFFSESVGGKLSAVTTSTLQGATTDDGATTPTAIAFPSAPSGANNTVDGDPDGNQARIALTLATVSGTFAANSVSQIEIVLTRLDSGSNPIGNPFSEIKVLATSDLSATSCVHEFYVKIGQRFRITKVIARNADKRAETTGTADFLAGGFILDGTCPAPSFQAQPAADGNKLASFTIRLANNATPVLFKGLTIEKSYGGGAFRNIEGSPIGLKSDDVLNVASGTKDFVFTVPRKPGVTLDVRATARMVGAVVSTTTNATQLAASTDDLGLDTAVPTLATNPDTATTGPTVKERHSKIDVSCPKPSDHINTLDNYQVILQSANTTPAGDPTVGSEAVLVIKYGQDPVFNLNYQAAFNADFYVRFRAHNQFGAGWSAWSAGTNQHGYSRPLQDFIGTAVPTHSEGLVRAGTSGTGHTTGTFVLDSGASAVDEFYTGMAIHLPTPGTSVPQEDRWRLITGYTGSSRTVVFNTVLSSAPSGSIAYDIHRIAIVGDRASKSGTGHTTTTIELDTGAESSITDFYKGYTLYLPGITQAGRRVRKVIAYNPSTHVLTVDVAYPVAPSGAFGYLLVNGSIGFSTANNAGSLTGVASPVPFRFYLDGATGLVKYEVLPPTDDNAFSLTHFQIISRRESNEVIRQDSGAKAIVSGLGHEHFASPSGTFYASAIRFRNLFRDGGSDGWSAYSYLVEVPQEIAGGGVPNYNPEVFGVAVLDYQGEASYSDQRYPSYN